MKWMVEGKETMGIELSQEACDCGVINSRGFVYKLALRAEDYKQMTYENT